MNIRHANANDAELLAEIGAKTFYDTYAEGTNRESLEASIKATYSPELQLEELSDPNSIFLIAELEEKTAGYAKLVMNRIEEQLSGSKPLKLSRIYLLKEFIGKGLGKDFMLRILQEAKEKNCDSVWLGVWSNNQKAIEFYKRFGFQVVGSYPFEFGDEVHNDLVMEMMLV